MSIFGQNPADITGALFKAKNLLDLPDKAAARTNLDVPSKAEVQYNSVPIGMIMPYWGSVAPAGFLPCSGQMINSTTFPDLVTFLGGTTSAVVPDLRGEFLRGWDNGRGIDAGRVLGGSQSASIVCGQAVNNPITVTPANYSTESASLWGVEPVASVPVGMDIAVTSGGGTLVTPATSNLGYTRPRNVAVLYCIKAYNSVSNYTSSVNIAGLVSDFSTLNSSAVKYADWTGANQTLSASGYQKLPGGLIMQWGATTATVGGATVSFPIVFPGNILRAVGGAANGSSAIAVSITGGTASGLVAYSASGSVLCSFVAIGY